MSKMGSHDPFGHLKHKLWPKKRAESQIGNLTPEPLKVSNRLDFVVFKRRTIYHWKSLDEGYNFVSDIISIGGLHAKLWSPKVVGVPTLTVGVPGENVIWMWASWRGT
jgi:hypothetical protein